MSEYYDFRKCTVCRSNRIREEYRGDYGVTMLLNTMYLAVTQQLEKPEGSGIGAEKIVAKLNELQCDVKKYNNDFPDDRIMKYLRNGLAHFNFIVESDSYNNIGHIIIYAIKHDQEKGEVGTLPYQVFDSVGLKCNQIENVICSFDFTVESLEKFTDYVIDEVLKEDTGRCALCSVNCQKRVEQSFRKEKI